MQKIPFYRPVVSAFTTTFMMICATAIGVTVMTAGPAAASIKCNGVFQATKNGPISTPICQDRQIAKVARGYGWKVTSNELGNYPLKKIRICQAIGNDVRLSGACDAYRVQGGRR